MSRLEEISKPFREISVNRNEYDNNVIYSSSHGNALSDGDELGKGENDGSIGGLTDIKQRKRLMTKNKYNSGNEYNAGNA